MRLLKIGGLFTPLRDISSSAKGFFRLLEMIGAICVLAHLSGCLWFGIAVADGMGPNNWPVQYGIADSDDRTKYISSGMMFHPHTHIT